MKTPADHGSDEAEQVLVDKLMKAARDLPSGEAARAAEERQYDSIRKALETRGDVFGRSDVLVLADTAQGVEIRVAVADLPVTIGSGEEVTVALAGRGVSQLHCRLERDEPLVRVVDEASRNGVYVNGRKVTAEHLSEGDVVTLGLINLTVNRA